MLGFGQLTDAIAFNFALIFYKCAWAAVSGSEMEKNCVLHFSVQFGSVRKIKAKMLVFYEIVAKI